MRKWAYCKVTANLETREWAFDLRKIERLIMALASLKFNMSVGYHFDTIVQVTHSFIGIHREYARIYLKGILAYKRFDIHVSGRLDKFNKMLHKLQMENPLQTSRYDGIVYELFPELLDVQDSDKLW